MIAQAHAERMKYALEMIVEGLRPYEEGDSDAELLTVEDVLRLARRGLDPDEWERVRD